MTIEREMEVNLRVMLLMMILLALTGPGRVAAYSQQELLTWMQRSNFGYQVLRQSLLDDVSSLATEDARCVAQVRLLVAGADAHAVTALRGKRRTRSSTYPNFILSPPSIAGSSRCMGQVSARFAVWPFQRHGQL